MLQRITLTTLALCLIIYVSYIGIKNTFRYNKLTQEHAKLTQQLYTTQQKHQQLINEIGFSNDENYWEYLAKKKLGFTRSTEVVYYVTID